MCLKPMFVCLLFFLPLSCSNLEAPKSGQPSADAPAPGGKLFIIGGGKRPPALVRVLVKASGIDRTGHAIILPMSSSEPDTAAYYAIRRSSRIWAAHYGYYRSAFHLAHADEPADYRGPGPSGASGYRHR